MKRLGIRWKLTLWYGGVLAVVLTVFSLAVYFTLRHQLLGRIDQGLDEELADVRYEITRATDAKTLHEWLTRRFAGHEGFDFQITRPDGERFFINPRLADRELPIPPQAAQSGTAAYESVSLAAGRWRVIRVVMQGPDGPLFVQVARSLAAFDHESSELLLAFLLTGPLTLLVAVGGGYFLARRALAPVQRMTQTADDISAERLNQRLEVENAGDELGALAETLNRMIGRLEQSFAEMQRFTADAAHELRTPLAVIRNEAEVALRSPRSPAEYARVLENLLEETNRLTSLAEQLLFLSRQDAGLHENTQEPVATHELVSEVVGNMQLVAQEKGVMLVLQENQPFQLASDPRQLRRVLYNLLDNAIKYTPPPGRASVRSTITSAGWALEVADTGMGIAPEHVPHIFERFYRIDPARSANGAGAGLGLSICRAIVKSLGGQIRADSTVGKGTTFRVVLPVHEA